MGATGSRASTLAPWQRCEQRSGTDLMYAARTMGMAAQLLRIPGTADAPTAATMMASHFLRAGLDRLLIAAHGPAGGSGRLHAAARACGLPVLGPDPRAIARAYDKLLCRQRLAFHNVPVPRTVALPHPDRVAATRLVFRLGWPCSHKPRPGSAGALNRKNSGPKALAMALAGRREDSLEPDLLVERKLDGREITVVVLDGRVLGMAEVSRSIEGGVSRIETMVCPPSLDRVHASGLGNIALRACAALELLEGPTCVDMVLTERDNEVVLEVEPLPPVHRDSIVARVARAAGMSYPQLCARMLAGKVADALAAADTLTAGAAAL
ncbi:MAG: hypothetical protein KC457_19635 [Myxococcales bacterium]|nr:hypothetical protein [Myxococcales bacterium]